MATQHLLLRGVPNAPERLRKLEVAHDWDGWLGNPCWLRGPQLFQARDGIRRPHHRSWWLHSLCHVVGLQLFRAGDIIKSGPQVRRVATQPLSSSGGPNAPE